MNRVEILERVQELIEQLDSASNELQEIKRDFVRYEDSYDDNEEINNLEEEIYELNQEIDNTKYRSDEFYSLQEKIEEKESELEKLKEEILSDENKADDEMEEILDKVAEVGYDIHEKQYELWSELGF